MRRNGALARGARRLASCDDRDALTSAAGWSRPTIGSPVLTNGADEVFTRLRRAARAIVRSDQDCEPPSVGIWHFALGDPICASPTAVPFAFFALLRRSLLPAALPAQETPTERDAARDVVHKLDSLERSLDLPALVARLTGAERRARSGRRARQGADGHRAARAWATTSRATRRSVRGEALGADPHRLSQASTTSR